MFPDKILVSEMTHTPAVKCILDTNRDVMIKPCPSECCLMHATVSQQNREQYIPLLGLETWEDPSYESASRGVVGTRSREEVPDVP